MRSEIISRKADCHESLFLGMFELAVISSLAINKPSILLEEFQNIPNFHDEWAINKDEDRNSCFSKAKIAFLESPTARFFHSFCE